VDKFYLIHFRNTRVLFLMCMQTECHYYERSLSKWNGHKQSQRKVHAFMMK